MLAAMTIGVAVAQIDCGTPQWYELYCVSPDSNFFMWEFYYTLAVGYGSGYQSGKGPYYDDEIFTDSVDGVDGIDESHHYEEYSFAGDVYAQTYLTMYFGTLNQPVYAFTIGGNVDAVTITPYKQVVWFQRGLSELIGGEDYSTHVYAGGAYEVKFGQAYLWYVESA